ncbi:MAG: hypothetical protein U0869_10585 [Chloroflexota bacterium]
MNLRSAQVIGSLVAAAFYAIGIIPTLQRATAKPDADGVQPLQPDLTSVMLALVAVAFVFVASGAWRRRYKRACTGTLVGVTTASALAVQAVFQSQYDRFHYINLTPFLFVAVPAVVLFLVLMDSSPWRED